MVLSPSRPRRARPATGRGEPPGEAEFRDDDAWIAQWIVVDAGVQAARLKRQACSQTAAIRQTAEREAEEIRRRASIQAAAIREAAEREATQLRDAIAKMSAGSGDLAYGDGGVAVKIAAPPARPAAKPAALRRNTKGRQARAMRKAVAALVVLSLTGLTAGAVEIELHGFSFFLFRNAGAGAGNPRDLDENQGPGQPDAPPPHHRAATPAAPGTLSP